MIIDFIDQLIEIDSHRLRKMIHGNLQRNHKVQARKQAFLPREGGGGSAIQGRDRPNHRAPGARPSREKWGHAPQGNFENQVI